jgi:hypothetical protein
MKRSTTQCHKYNHPEFTLEVGPEVIEPDLDWLIRYLEESVAQGTRYVPGQTVQLGWTILEVRDLGDLGGNRLALFEPDMEHMPIHFVNSVTRCLVHLRVQKDVVESVLPAESLAFPSQLHAGLRCSRLRSGAGMIMSRSQPDTDEKSVSGWFAGCDDDGHDHNDPKSLQYVSLYEMAKDCPGVIPYLALPPGSGLVIPAKGRPTICFEEQELKFKKGSMLELKYGGGGGWRSFFRG